MEAPKRGVEYRYFWGLSSLKSECWDEVYLEHCMEGAPQNPLEETPDADLLGATPDVLAHLHTTHSHRHEYLDADAPALLHREVCQTKHGECYQYVPTFKHLHTSIQRVTALLGQDLDSHTPGTDLHRTYTLISQRDKHIQAAVHQYVSSLIQFYNITKNRAWREDSDQRDRLKEIDLRRRRAHDSVIESLSVYTKLVTTLHNEGYLDGLALQEWSSGDPMPPIENDHHCIVIFSGQFLRNREQVKDWAIQADIAHVMDDITAAQEQQKAGITSVGNAR